MLDIETSLNTDITTINQTITASQVQLTDKQAFLNRISGFTEHLKTMRDICDAFVKQYADYITKPEYATLTTKDKNKLANVNTEMQSILTKLNNFLG